MASETEHIDVANRNQATLAFLCTDHIAHAPWIAVVAFYKALHVVEAVFANDATIVNTHDHKTRELRLKTTRRYSQVNVHYQPLERASTIARYMTCESFHRHIEFDKTIPILLSHHLHQLELSAAQIP